MATEDQDLNVFSLSKAISEQVIAKCLLSEVLFNCTVQRILIIDDINYLTHKPIPHGWGTAAIGGKACIMEKNKTAGISHCFWG